MECVQHPKHTLTNQCIPKQVVECCSVACTEPDTIKLTACTRLLQNSRSGMGLFAACKKAFKCQPLGGLDSQARRRPLGTYVRPICDHTSTHRDIDPRCACVMHRFCLGRCQNQIVATTDPGSTCRSVPKVLCTLTQGMMQPQTWSKYVSNVL